MIDSASFDTIVIEHQDRVYRIVVSVLGPGFEADAEDVAQDVFVRLLHTLDSFRGESSLGTWIHRVAFNLAVTRKRRARFRSPHVGTDVLSAASASAKETHASPDLMRAVDRLPDAYRAVIHLHYWMGESVDEIATTLSRPPGTVKSQLHRARALLRDILEERP